MIQQIFGVNELLFFVQMLLSFLGVVLCYKFFGKVGMLAAAAVVTLYANLEVANQVTMFGLAVSLGNIAFVANSLIQDVLNQTEGEKVSAWSVWIGFFTSIFILILAQCSIRYVPNEYDVTHTAFTQVFDQFSIVTLISLATFLVSNRLNVKLFTLFAKHTDKLWIRSQASSWISQCVDTVMMTVLCAVFGVFDWSQVVMLIVTSYIIKIIIVVCQLPFVYWCKSLKMNGKVKEIVA